MEANLILKLTLLLTIFWCTIEQLSTIVCSTDFIREFWQPVEASCKEFRKINVFIIPKNRKTWVIVYPKILGNACDRVRFYYNINSFNGIFQIFAKHFKTLKSKASLTLNDLYDITCMIQLVWLCKTGFTLNDLYDTTCMTLNRLSNVYGVHAVTQVVHTKFIKVVLTDYSVFRNSSKII